MVQFQQDVREMDVLFIYYGLFGLRIEMCQWVSEPHELVNDSV